MNSTQAQQTINDLIIPTSKLAFHLRKQENLTPYYAAARDSLLDATYYLVSMAADAKQTSLVQWEQTLLKEQEVYTKDHESLERVNLRSWNPDVNQFIEREIGVARDLLRTTTALLTALTYAVARSYDTQGGK
jgi:hypothetical protein